MNRTRTKRNQIERKMAEDSENVVRPHVLGAGGQRFKSSCPDQHLEETEQAKRSRCRSETPETTSELIARFWSYVDKRGPDECWPWHGARSSCGYGNFKLLDRKNTPSSRLAYYLSSGHWPGELLVCHACDNPPCCNPAHLFLGTTRDNAADMMAKGRWRGGNNKRTNNPQARLTEEDVAEIRRSIAFGQTNVSIAARYGVTHSLISAIRRGKAWRDDTPLLSLAEGVG